MILEIHYLWRNIIKLSGLRRNIWVRMIPKPVVTALRQSKPGVFWAFPDDISTREGGGCLSLNPNPQQLGGGEIETRRDQC